MLMNQNLFKSKAQKDECVLGIDMHYLDTFSWNGILQTARSATEEHSSADSPLRSASAAERYL